jgi:ATP-dependent Lon protease
MPPDVANAAQQCHEICPVLPLRDACLFPGASLELVVARTATIRAVDIALRSGARILALSQRDPDLPSPAPRDMHGVGTIALVGAKVEQPDGSFRIELDGVTRASVVTLIGLDTILAEVEALEEGETGDDWGAAVEALARYIHAHSELKGFLDKQRTASDPMAWVNLACQHLPITASARQKLLESNAAERCVKISRGLDALLRKEQAV